MAEVSNDLIYEVLKSLQTHARSVDFKLDEIKSELAAMRGHMTATQQDVANIYTTLTRQDQRLDRIERRLDLAEPAR